MSSEDSRLSADQLAHYRTFGFLALRQVFSPSEVARIVRLHDEVMAADRQGRPYDGAQRQCVMDFLGQRRELIDLLVDDRLHHPLTGILGADATWLATEGNLYAGDTCWHADSTAESMAWHRLKIALYLDPVGRDSGALRVIPGSHRLPLFQELADVLYRSDARAGFGVPPQEMPGVAVESRPGDVVIFDQLIWHASFGGRVGRRMIAMSFAAKPADDRQLGLLAEIHRDNLEPLRKTGARDRLYGDLLLTHEHPRIRRMVAPLVALGLR